MKNFITIYYISILLSLIGTLKAQEKPKIKSDSLLRMFKTMDAFDVLNKVYTDDIDVKDCYYNEELKPYVLKWLDKEAYFEFLQKERITRETKDKDFCINDVKGWLTKYNKSHLIDTVLKDLSLFKVYLDSVTLEEKEYFRKRFFGKGGRLPTEAIYFHALLKLPESYEILHRYWKEDGGKVSSEYFYTMLAMHDPEAIAMYNKYVDSVIVVKDLRLLDDINGKSGQINLYGSYSLELKLKLLMVNVKKTHSFSDFGDGIFYSPFNIDLINPLVDAYFQCSQNKIVLNILNKIYNPIDKIRTLKYAELEKAGNEIIENIEEFKKVLQPHIENMKKEEKYWKQKMPYYKESNRN